VTLYTKLAIVKLQKCTH